MSWLSWQEGERVAVSLQLVKTAAEWETIVQVQHLQVLNHWMFLTGSQDILQLQCVVCGKKTETKKDLGTVWSRGRVCCATTKLAKILIFKNPWQRQH